MLSIVIPVKNEEETIPGLAAEVSQAMQRLVDADWECIWVNDGSTDRTAEVLAKVVQDDPHHRWLRLERSFGQSAGLVAGFSQARGAYLATLDGGAQNDPADLPDMFAQLRRDNVDMVNGVRAKRQDSLVRKLSSKVGNGFRNALTGNTVTDVGCAIRVFRKELARQIPVWKGMHRFFPTLAVMQGYRITERPVNHRPRTQGKTKYGINNRLWVGIADTIAVVWMKRRLVWPKIADQSPPEQG